MSIQSITESLKKFLSSKKSFKLKSIARTREYLKKFDFLISDASLSQSLKLTKQAVLQCNRNYSKDNGSRLNLAEDLILSYLKSCKSLQQPVPESLLKLLIITYLNQSFLYQSSKPNKSVEAVIKATKVSEQHILRSRKGKLLKFNAKLRQCQLYTDLGKLDLAIQVSQSVLQEVLKKLEKKSNKKLFKHFVMVAVTAFYRIGICEKLQGLVKSSELAFKNATAIIEKYLPANNMVLDLEFQMLSCRNSSQPPIEKAKPKNKTQELPADCKGESETSIESQTNSALFLSPGKNETSVGSLVVDKTQDKNNERYYSKDKLAKLQKMMNEEKTRIILNTDNYFFKKISKHLAINGDLKVTALNVRENVDNQLHDVWLNKELLKKKKKMVHSMTSQNLANVDIQEKIEDLQENFKSRLKTQESKLKFKLKTKIYKQLLRSINVPVKSSKNFPAQKLFFRPPEKRIDTIKSIREKTGLLPENVKLFEDAKQEIEDHMRELKHDIEGIEKNIETFAHGGACQLAKSTIIRRAADVKVKKSIVKTLVKVSSLKKIRNK